MLVVHRVHCKSASVLVQYLLARASICNLDSVVQGRGQDDHDYRLVGSLLVGISRRGPMVMA